MTGRALRSPTARSCRATTPIADARLTYRLIPYPSPEFQNTMVTWAKQLEFPARRISGK